MNRIDVAKVGVYLLGSIILTSIRFKRLAIYMAKCGLRWASSKSPAIESMFYDDLSIIYAEFGEYDLALEMLQRAQELSGWATYNLNAALIYEEKRDFQLALFHYRRALQEDSPEQIDEKRDWIEKRIQMLETLVEC